MRAGLGFLAVLAACAAVGDAPGSGAPVPAHETFFARATAVGADTVRVLLPVSYEGELSLSGLSEGWTTDGDLRVWQGTGECAFRLRALTVRCRTLSVTLRPPAADPEFILQAEGGVSFTHDVSGLTEAAEGLSFLMLRNDRRLSR